MTPQSTPIFRIAHIFKQTRELMRVDTLKMSATASRGVERGNPTTRSTTPRFPKRRHSIDVNTTEGWGTPYEEARDEEKPEWQPWRATSHELDPPPALSYQYGFPYPGRYAPFGTVFQLEPPDDEDVYLELGDATISNAAFRNISVTNGSFLEAWMHDVSLDMCLEVLRQDTDCNNHGIAIVTSLVSQICLYAANSTDSSPQEYSEYESRLQNKKWIFIVVTDAESNIGDAVAGTHWSLVVLNRLNSVAYYFDSMFINQKSYQDRACNTSLGMLKILGEDVSLWNWSQQFNSPHQIVHNQMKDDSGACGPFVLKMTEILIQHIRLSQSGGKENEFDLSLDRYFAHTFRSVFHSGRVRKDMQRRIAHYKAIADAPVHADTHDHAAIHGLDVKLDNGPIIAFQIPRRAKEPLQCDIQQSHGYGPVGLNRHRYFSPEEDNYVVHETSSYCGDKQIIELSDSEGNGYRDININEDSKTEDEDGDEDAGPTTYDPQRAYDQFFVDSLPRITNSPVHSGDENSTASINGINDFDVDSTVDVFVSGASNTDA
ncbi:hypothetical protein DDE83_000603 [Stemphylium lycopersici]|uniref:Ubiquitin-like protease family profile domain-containing protein n=1 Tax=Stemphylium lycopersici TaxID=183478 RepID=A0A364NFE3_STELY|nr:hypothetical protein DDE83_000603 [Stemphylium lycopersici]